MNNTAGITLNSVEEIKAWLENLIGREGPFFDKDGVLRCAINARTLKPFTADWAKTQKQPKPPEPYGIDYLAGVNYEDTWDTTGNYLTYLAARYEVTAEKHLIDEMARMVTMAIEVYREDNPPGMPEWLAAKGFFRRLYGGRYGKWPHPEILGTDQMAPLMFGLLQTKPYLNEDTRKELDEVLTGILGWYMRRNFAYLYRGRTIHNIEGGSHALSYYIPALLHAYKATGEAKYLKKYERLHEDYMYNPEFYLSTYEMPYIQSFPAPEDRMMWLHAALRWCAWVPWLYMNAPNKSYYEFLFDEFVEWNTRLLKNTLPEGLGHDYDNLAPTTRRYPREWLKKLPEISEDSDSHDGFDYNYISYGRMPPLRKVREHTYFAIVQPEKVDITPVAEILRRCNTPDHFTYFYDPDDELPVKYQIRSYVLHAQFVTAWLTAYWRLKKSDVFR